MESICNTPQCSESSYFAYSKFCRNRSKTMMYVYIIYDVFLSSFKSLKITIFTPDCCQPTVGKRRREYAFHRARIGCYHFSR